MLYIYTDPELLGMSDTPWYLSERPFLALRSKAEGFSAFVGVHSDSTRPLLQSPVPKEPQYKLSLLEVDVSFALVKGRKSGGCLVVRRPTQKNDIDLFLGLILKGNRYPAVHDRFTPALCWGAGNSRRMSIQQLSFRNRRESILDLADLF